MVVGVYNLTLNQSIAYVAGYGSAWAISLNSTCVL